jgi:hypothetical protein
VADDLLGEQLEEAGQLRGAAAGVGSSKKARASGRATSAASSDEAVRMPAADGVPDECWAMAAMAMLLGEGRDAAGWPIARSTSAGRGADASGGGGAHHQGAGS